MNQVKLVGIRRSRVCYVLRRPGETIPELMRSADELCLDHLMAGIRDAGASALHLSMPTAKTYPLNSTETKIFLQGSTTSQVPLNPA